MSARLFLMCFPSGSRRPKKAAPAPAGVPATPRATPVQQAARARMRDEAEVLRVSALTLAEEARLLARQVDTLVALEIDHGYQPALSSQMQHDLTRLLPPAAPRAAPPPASQAPSPSPPPTPDAIAAAIERYPALADTYAWDFFEHARKSFEPLPEPKLRLRFTAAPPPLDVRDHVHHAALALRRALPAPRRMALDTIVMHFDHEVLCVAYRNAHTMVLNEPISTIPRASFLATADGYAWDMQELVQAIAANGGVFKNPLTHIWFAESDIKAILAHPMGTALRRAKADQERLRDGVREETALALRKLGTALMNDQANDGHTAVASALAIAEFRAFLLTLPDNEQRDIAALRTTGIDRHTCKVFSASQVQAVLDDTGTCFHKRGDLLEQTAVGLLQRLAGR